MKITKIYQEFESLAEQLKIRLIIDKGNFYGGYCILEKEKVIVLNKNKPLEHRIKQLAMVISNINTTNIFVKPRIREIINQNSL